MHVGVFVLVRCACGSVLPCRKLVVGTLVRTFCTAQAYFTVWNEAMSTRLVGKIYFIFECALSQEVQECIQEAMQQPQSFRVKILSKNFALSFTLATVL